MPSTKLDVVNRVLGEIGRLQVTAITDSDDALYISGKVDELYPEVLLDCMWNSAIIYREDNTPLTDNYSPDYTYTYQLPGDFGRFYKFGATGEILGGFAIVGSFMLAYARPVHYYYISNQIAYELLTPLMVRTLVLYVASTVAPVLTNNMPLAAYLAKVYGDAKVGAILQNQMDTMIIGAPNDFDRINYV